MYAIRGVLRKPLRIYLNDGDQPAPEGGILLFCAKAEQPTLFDTVQQAEAAIKRTGLAHEHTFKTPADYSLYHIQTIDEFEDEELRYLHPSEHRRKHRR